MLSSDLTLAAEHFLVLYRDLLLIDPFYRISVDVVDGDWISQCKPDGAALSWRISLNAERHRDVLDIKMSIVDGLLRVMFADFDRVGKSENYAEIRDGILARLATVLSNLLPDSLEETADEEVGQQQGA